MLRLSSRSALRPSVHPPMSRSRTFKSAASIKSAQDSLPSGYSVDPSASPMLRFQASVPQLPVPSLSSTASRYLETVQPHLTPSEYANTEAAIASFLLSPVVADLQKRLEARSAEPNMKNWLADWWNDVAYMGYRDPVVVFVSYFFVHLDEKIKHDQAERGARLLKALLSFRQLTESEQLEPERVKNAPLCMHSYKWLFHATRRPAKPSDTAQKFDFKSHNHVVFIRKNKFFKVPLTTPGGTELSAAELQVQIEKVIGLAGQEKGVPIGSLTSDNRDNWADAREILLKASPLNLASLTAIESAAIVVCLDDTSPITREDISRSCWVGDGRNRFYDKHQLIVFENGRSGFLGEHSCMDGMPTLRMNEFVLATLATNKIDLGPKRDATTGSNLPEPAELKFVLDSSGQLENAVRQAARRFDSLVGAHDLHVLHYEGYGKDAIKQFRASPDAWAQLVKQLAFQKMFGRPGVTYESAQTRKYQLGRTEVIRSASNETKKWILAMLDPTETDEHRAQLFRAAVTRHLQYATWAADGQGVDRHLFGLKKMLKEGEELPDIYKDAAFAKTSSWELSTSQLSSPYLDGWGYGEVVPDGYGLAYSIGNNYIRWTITSLKRNTAELKHYLAEAATETREMMERAAKAEAAKTDGKAKL